MPKKNGAKPKRLSVIKTFSFPPNTAEFIEKRGESVGSGSEYMKRLVEHDREHNTLGESLRKDADRMATA